MNVKGTVQMAAFNVKEVHSKHINKAKIPVKKLFSKVLSTLFGLFLIGLGVLLLTMEVKEYISIAVIGFGCFNLSKDAFLQYLKMLPKLILAVVKALKGESINGDAEV